MSQHRRSTAGEIDTSTVDNGDRVRSHAERGRVANVALPPISVPVPNVAAPFLNVTVPVGVPLVDDLIFAVNVTETPCFDGFFEDVTALVVAALCTAWVRAAAVLAVKLASPA